MSRVALSRTLLCLLLLGASSMAMAARGPSMHGPNDDGGGCPDATPTTAAATAAVKSVAPVASHLKAKPVIGLRGGGSDVGTSHAPRWHSFLPGMFR